MEAAAPWERPFEHQLATRWTAEEPAADEDAQAWAPAVGLPLQYASIVDIFGSCSLQPYVVPASSSSGGHQQVEYNYYANANAAATQHDDPIIIERATTTKQELPLEVDSYVEDPDQLFEKAERKFKRDARLMKRKMHRYPPNIGGLGAWYTAPRVVAIGPYHHCDGDHLKPAEKVKHVAARHCTIELRLSVRKLYHAVVCVAAEIDARRLYDDKDAMEGIDYEDNFLPMMFYDACFLVMYMRKRAGMEIDAVLHDFFESNENDIAHDIMLLENQIPWPIVEAIVNKYKSETFLEKFVTEWKDGCLQDRVVDPPPAVKLVEDYEPPHLLGLLRFYIVGKRTKRTSDFGEVSESDAEKMKSIAISVGAIELAEMGIHLAAKKTAQLPDMGLARKWIVFAELTMAPLSLNDLRASLLVNMAALELCTTPAFFDEAAEFEDSAVCSYLLLLCMLMHKEADVHELRTNGILEGGAGLTDKNTLDFFTSLQSLRQGRCYALVVVEIQNYRNKRPWIKLYGYGYRNWKYIAGVFSIFAAFIGIITTLMKIKGNQ